MDIYGTVAYKVGDIAITSFHLPCFGCALDVVLGGT